MRPVLRTCDLNPNDVYLAPGVQWALRCPDCHEWWSVQRSKVTPHRGRAGGAAWCPGSQRRVEVEHPAAWAVRSVAADAECEARIGCPPFMPQPLRPDRVVENGLSDPSAVVRRKAPAPVRGQIPLPFPT